MALLPFRARRSALHRVMAAPRTKGPFFVRSPLLATIYRRKNFPPYLTRQASLLSGFILGPVWGPSDVPPCDAVAKPLRGRGVGTLVGDVSPWE